ncbi:hypothetical protein AUCHE_18_00330 [Austwickia chelonae NBRC 105200]|uniref:Uncharacterized protein n=1 Tax=Austwickia chelonae NBRC 105200 TaxID=1184607 RepID=K6WB43_9MICO|nr:hypothetical protein AUCHE_18_00330 [Austwickia chelonae NBRC 105200]
MLDDRSERLCGYDGDITNEAMGSLQSADQQGRSAIFMNTIHERSARAYKQAREPCAAAQHFFAMPRMSPWGKHTAG